MTRQTHRGNVCRYILGTYPTPSISQDFIEWKTIGFHKVQHEFGIQSSTQFLYFNWWLLFIRCVFLIEQIIPETLNCSSIPMDRTSVVFLWAELLDFSVYLWLIYTHDTALSKGKQRVTGHITEFRVWACEWHLHCNSSTDRFSLWLWHLDGGFWRTGSAEGTAPLAFSISPCVVSHWTSSPRHTWAPTGIPALYFWGAG